MLEKDEDGNIKVVSKGKKRGRKSDPNKKIYVGVRVTKNIHKKIMEEAYKENNTVTAAVENALEKYFEKID